MAEIASAYVSLIPSARGFGTATSAQINPQMRKTGAAGGALLGKSMLKAFIAIGVATKIAQFLGDSVAEAREANKVAALTNNVIKTTGGVAKVSAIQVNRLADALSRKTGIDDEQIATSENLLLTFKNIKREGTGLENIFNRATRASVDLSASGFGSMESTAKMLGKALNDPLKGLTALGRAGVTFTQQQQDQIKALVASGNALKAQKIILREVESQVGGAAAAQATNADKAGVALGNLKELIGKSLVPVLDGMAGVFANRIAPALTTFITNLQSGQGRVGAFGAFIRGSVVPALQQFWNFIVTRVVPAMRGALASALKSARSAFNTVRDAVRENRPQLEQLGRAFVKVAIFVQTQLIPALIRIQAKVLPVLGFAIKMVIAAAAFWVSAFNKVRAAVEAVKSAVTRMIAVVKAMPAKIKAAVGSLGHLLYSAGQSVIQGLIDGITSKIGALTSKLHALTSLIPKHKGPPSKDKMLLYSAGRDIIDGLIDGMRSKENDLTKHLKDLTAKVRDQLTSARSDFASLVDPISSNFTQGLFEFDTASEFTANLTTVKGTLTTMLANFKKLLSEGLNPGFLYQLFQAGGPGLINGLAALDAAGAQQAGSLFGEVSSLSTQLGTAVAGATDKGAALENQTQRLEKKLDHLIKAVHNSADRTAEAVTQPAKRARRRAVRAA